MTAITSRTTQVGPNDAIVLSIATNSTGESEKICETLLIRKELDNRLALGVEPTHLRIQSQIGMVRTHAGGTKTTQNETLFEAFINGQGY